MEGLNIFPRLRSICSDVLFAALKFCPDAGLLDARKPSILYKSHEPKILEQQSSAQFSHFQLKLQARGARSKGPLSSGPWSPW